MAERTVLESIPQRRIISASLQSSVYDAACKMAKAHCGSVLIVDESGSMLGIFTERDLMVRVVAQALDPKKTPLSEVMTPNPLSVSPETSVHDAVFIMKQHAIRHLPILSPTAAVIGVFSIRDALPREITDADDLLDNLDQQFTNVLA
jgi:CBS domain-containing protein